MDLVVGVGGGLSVSLLMFVAWGGVGWRGAHRPPVALLLLQIPT